jgi:hypothetical protein
MLLRVVAAAMAACGFVYCGAAVGQGVAESEESVTTIHGRVLNQDTGEAVSRALVTMAGDEYATFTNDRGEFEFKVSEQKDSGNSALAQRQFERRNVTARKPGFLYQWQMPMTVYRPTSSTDAEVMVYLVPEALIVGHVNVLGPDEDVRIDCELYRRRMRDGRETWSDAGNFETWSDMEFRFSELPAGTYKLITHEGIDRDSVRAGPGAQVYGYPPIYYPNTTDFSVASPIVVKAGETAQVNLTVARKAYYLVRIGVTNAPVEQGMRLVVYPMGHHSPGWSLGYNAAEHVIEGRLPDGNYTVEANAEGAGQSSGILNFAVKGRAFEGATLNMVPNGSVSVNVREQFQTEQSNFGEGNELIRNSVNGRRLPNARVVLMPLEDFSISSPSPAVPAPGSDGHAQVFNDVRPGKYRVIVSPQKGYVASIESSGADVMHQPLVVGLGGGVAPIEVLLRDDGGEVDGTIEEASEGQRDLGQTGTNLPVRYVYLLKMNGSEHDMIFRGYGSSDDTFRIQQVAPGDYLVVAFDAPLNDSPEGDDEKMEELKTKGQVIHVEAGEKVSLKVRVIAGNGE